MKKILLLVSVSFTIIFCGCLEIEEGVRLNENGSGIMEVKTDMSQLMAMLSMMSGDKDKTAIKKDTVITYKNYLDTATSVAPEVKELLYNAAWRLEMDSEDGVFVMTFKSPFKKPGDVANIMAALDKMDQMDIMGQALKGMGPGDDEGMGMDQMGLGKGGDKSFGDMTKNYFTTSWQKGKLVKTLDTLAYKKIGDDETLNSYKKLGELGQGGEDILENIKVVTKIVLPVPARKAEGKSIEISDDKKTILIRSAVADIYSKLKNFEYYIEY